MKLGRLSTLALRNRREGLAQRLPHLEETLRGSLIQRFMSCGNPDCKCARGERHGPFWYLSVTLGPGRTTGGVAGKGQLERVRRWVENYRQGKSHLEQISEINRELLRRERQKAGT